MPKIVSGSSAIHAWWSATAEILEAGFDEYVMVVEFDSSGTSKASLRAVDLLAAGEGAERPRSVASMLMPQPVIEHPGGASDALSYGLAMLERGRTIGKRYSGWQDTYFERMCRGFGTPGAAPLFNLCDKARKWGTNHQAAFYLHTSGPGDGFRTMGAPCLQYVQVRLTPNATLELVSLYRSHDYFDKALGNFVGLERLGTFIATQTQRCLTRVTNISLHPFSKGSKRSLRAYRDAVGHQFGF